MGSQRVNALRVLPRDLFLAVSKALGGESVDLYIPSVRSLRRLKRDQAIVEMRAKGHTADDIANELFIHPTTVWRVLARERAASAPSDQGAAPGRQ